MDLCYQTAPSEAQKETSTRAPYGPRPMHAFRCYPSSTSPTVHRRADSQRASDASSTPRTPSLGAKYGYTPPATVTHPGS